MKKKIVVILILSTKDVRYKKFIDACNQGWVKLAREKGIRCIFYSGGAEKNSLENDNLFLNCDDSLSGTALKLYKALEFLENNKVQYTHIYRTNLSSFIFIDAFLKYIDSINDDIYGGVIGYFNKFFFFNKFHFLGSLASKSLSFQVIKFASGSGFFLSKKYVLKLLLAKNINFNFIDDVMLGSVLENINIVPIPRYDIVDFLPLNYDPICFHIRLKSSNRHSDSDRLQRLIKFNSLEDLVLRGDNFLESL